MSRRKRICAMATLDPELHIKLIQKDISADKPIYILLKFSGDIAALSSAPFTVGSIIGNIAYGKWRGAQGGNVATELQRNIDRLICADVLLDQLDMQFGIERGHGTDPLAS